MTPLRIAVAVQALDVLGGKERDALAIAGELAKRGHKVTVVTRSASLKIPPGVSLQKTGTHGWSNHARARLFARAVAGIKNATDFDAVLSFEKLGEADAYYAADVYFGGRASGLKGLLPRYASYARLEADCFGAGGPDILFLCRKQSDEYRSVYRIDSDRAAILPAMIHDSNRRAFYERRDAIRQRFDIPAAAPLAVSVAVYPHQKGVDRTIAALRDIPDLHLLAVGLRDIASAKAQAAKFNVDARTRFFGHSDEIADILGAADLFLHPARLENTGLVILESLVAGVPAIASAVCGFAEYIERFGAGVVLPEPFDESRYIAAIHSALEPHTLDKLKRLARESAPVLLREGGLERIVDVIEDRLAKRLHRKPALHA